MLLLADGRSAGLEAVLASSCTSTASKRTPKEARKASKAEDAGMTPCMLLICLGSSSPCHTSYQSLGIFWCLAIHRSRALVERILNMCQFYDM